MGMVGQLTNGLNTVKRIAVLSAIVAVGLLDLAVTTYISHEEIFDTPQNVVSRTGSFVAAPAVGSQPALAEVNTNDESLASVPVNIGRTEPSVRATGFPRIDRRRRFRNNVAAAVIPVKLSQPAAECRAVSYPFVGDEYVVQVTDETACLTLTAARYRRDRLIAQVVPRRNRW
jgi:hypothetical protein